MFLINPKKIISVLFLVTFISTGPGAIEKPGDFSDKLVPSSVRLTNTFSTSSGFEEGELSIHSFMKKWKIAGASIAIARDGKLVFAKGFGYSDTSSMTHTQPFNRFRIASISKLVTAVAIMKLNEEGKLSLNGRVFGPGGILSEPYFSNPKDKRVDDITVAHLLSHEGGWTQRYGDQMFMPLVVAQQMGVEPPVDTRTIIRFALDKRLHFTPGTGRSYSNLGYSILGLVIEKLSGMPYDEYCRREIFEPLGIYDMLLAGNLPSERAPFEVTYYEPNKQLRPSIYGTGELVSPMYGGNDIEALGGAGSWISTAPDLMRLLLAVDGFNTREDILSDESIRFMTDANNGFAPVGWKTTVMDGNWWRTGSFSGTAGMLKRQPDGISWVVLLNSSAWNGPEIHNYVNRMMTSVVSRVSSWPEYDLFQYSLPLPLKVQLTQDSLK